MPVSTERASLRRFVESAGIGMSVERADKNPNMDTDEWAVTATHWKCTLRAGRSRMTVYFSQGSAHAGKPNVEDVLDCLASDAAGYENAPTFEAWCGDYGYDIDSRSAERAFRAVERQSKRLRAFLGDSAYETLLWKTERL